MTLKDITISVHDKVIYTLKPDGSITYNWNEIAKVKDVYLAEPSMRKHMPIAICYMLWKAKND